jgi:hypothetical protein
MTRNNSCFEINFTILKKCIMYPNIETSKKSTLRKTKMAKGIKY